MRLDCLAYDRPTRTRDALRALLTPAERRLFARLDTPQKIQDFLDKTPANFELDGDTVRSPRMMLQARMAHCAEAALFAAAALMFHGRQAWLMDLRALPRDQDHVVTLFRERGLWGAISKTNHAILRWRDPIYRSARELAMSYAHEYCLPGGKKSLHGILAAVFAHAPRARALGDRRERFALADGRARRFAARAGGAAAGDARAPAFGQDRAARAGCRGVARPAQTETPTQGEHRAFTRPQTPAIKPNIRERRQKA